MYLTRSNICIALVLLLVTFSNVDADSRPFEFALIGDMPYGMAPGENNVDFNTLIDDLNSNKSILWILHAGDIKAGSTPCSDEMLVDRRDRFSKFTKPFILTPGDNEWTDCHRVAAGEYDPLDRLAKLRELFYPDSFFRKNNALQLHSQSQQPRWQPFRENLRWFYHDVLFLTVHVVGSRNGMLPFDNSSQQKRTSAHTEEVKQRTAAAVSWIEEGFAEAQRLGAKGVFIMMHADMNLEKKRRTSAFKPVIDALDEGVSQFKKPVLLAHGDSHFYTLDHPSLTNWNAEPYANLTRVITPGSTNSVWLRIQVKPDSDDVFTVSLESIFTEE